MTDHVFRRDENGVLQFVGDFEAVYRDNPDPWDQGAETGELASYYQRSRARLAFLLSFLHPHEGEFLEVGCGHGHATRYLATQLPGKWSGMDTSREALKGARLRYGPEVKFWRGNILAHQMFMSSKYDAVILGEMFFHILHEIDAAVQHARDLVRPGGLLLLSHGCPWPELQPYGREEALGVDGVMKAWLDAVTRVGGLSLVLVSVDHLLPRFHHDHLVIALQRY